MSDDGVRWVDYRKTLIPNYTVVWCDIALCYVFLAIGAVSVPVASLIDAQWVVLIPAAIWTGYWLHSLFLFAHEAAHSNLARRRKTNDRLGDWFVWIFYGSTTVSYRRTHMTHHAHLGDHHDTEISYHLCLSALNMIKAVTGVHVLEVLLLKRKQGGKTPKRSARAGNGLLASVRSMIVHVAIIAGLLLSGSWAGALAWIIAVGAFFPLFATLRTVVEHRRLDASCDVDFTVELHGPVNRLFGTGPLSRTFGSAGFNRHLLHHWDPAISYTNFAEMERFLSRTPLAAEMEASRIGYGSAFKTLIKEAHRG